MTRGRIFTLAAALVVVGLGLYAIITFATGSYTAKLIIPSAAQMVDGSPVWINGVPAGSVTDLSVHDGKAVVDVDIDSDYAPLHEGTTTWVEWYSATGERVLELKPGPVTNAEIPDGGIYAPPPDKTKQVEVDQVLAALDAPTRDRLRSLIGNLNSTVDDKGPQIKEALDSAGPAVEGLGAVLEGIGRDGNALKSLVTQLNQVTATASEHRQNVSNTVGNLTAVTGQIATQQKNISEALKEAPSTLSVAKNTLDQVPGAVDATNPLLDDLRPTTEKLPSVSKNLSGVMQDLRPAVADLRPTLDSLQGVLGKTPELLDTSHDVLPPVQSIAEGYQPAVSFLRPYTPELIGWLHNFGQGFSRYDSQGHFWSATLAPGANALDDSVVRPPTSYSSVRPAPGEAVGQPWKDAWGSDVN